VRLIPPLLNILNGDGSREPEGVMAGKEVNWGSSVTASFFDGARADE
jgi:hypothetical protein